MNTYAKAIEVLMNSDVDYREVVIKLAQTRPALFLAIVSPKPADRHAPPEGWVVETVNYLPDNKIMAIKTVRGNTGMGLKDAKDVVDQVEHKLGLRTAGWSPCALETEEQHNAYNALLHYARTLSAPRFPNAAKFD